MARHVKSPAITARIAKTGFLDFFRKYAEKNVAGTTLETPMQIPIMVMLSPIEGFAMK